MSCANFYSFMTFPLFLMFYDKPEFHNTQQILMFSHMVFAWISSNCIYHIIVSSMFHCFKEGVSFHYRKMVFLHTGAKKWCDSFPFFWQILPETTHYPYTVAKAFRRYTFPCLKQVPFPDWNHLYSKKSNRYPVR